MFRTCAAVTGSTTKMIPTSQICMVLRRCSILFVRFPSISIHELAIGCFKRPKLGHPLVYWRVLSCFAVPHRLHRVPKATPLFVLAVTPFELQISLDTCIPPFSGLFSVDRNQHPPVHCESRRVLTREYAKGYVSWIISITIM